MLLMLLLCLMVFLRVRLARPRGTTAALWLLMAPLAIGCGATGPAAPAANKPADKNSASATLIVAGSTLAVAGQGRGPAALVGGSDWPGFLGPNGDGTSPERGLPADWPREGPPLLWRTEIAEGYAAPSISAGRLFLFDRQRERNRLRCLESRTGKPLWHFEYATEYEDTYGYSNGPRCCPVIDDDRVYILGAEGLLHCLRAADGHVLWKCDTMARFGVVQNFFGVGSTPVVEGDLLIAQVGGSPPRPPDQPAPPLGQVQSNGTAIVAFDKRTGDVKYRAGDELASYASPVLATIAGRRWGFVFARSGLIGFEPATGKIDFHYLWRAKILESVNASNPVVVGNEVFISETYGPGSSLLTVRPGGCDVQWRDDARKRDKALQTHWNTPIYQAGYLYGSSGRNSDNAELRCIEWKSGRVMWSRPGMARATLLYVDGHFVVLGEYGTLWLIRAASQRCEIVAEWPLGTEATAPARRLLNSPCWAAPVLSHGLLYVRGKNRLVCLELIAAARAP